MALSRLIQRRGGNIGNCARAFVASASSATSPPLEGDDVQEMLTRLDHRFRRPATANADEVFSDLKALHGANMVIPQSFYVDALRLLTTRKDSIRTELLLRMAQTNIVGSPEVVNTGNRSRPAHDSYSKLVSYAVTGLLRAGCVEEALTLLVRMTATGYLTSRISLEKILDRIGGSGQVCPPISFIDKVHKMVSDNRWDQAPRYYTRLLKVLRQHLLWSCHNKVEVDTALQRMDSIWLQAEIRNGGKIADVELLSIRVQCLLVAARIYKSNPAMSDLPRSLECIEQARQVFHGVLNASKQNTDQAMVEKIRSLVENITVDDGLHDITAKDMFKIASGKRQPNLKQDRLLGSSGTSPSSPNPRSLNFAWAQPNEQFRAAFSSLITEVAQAGHVDDALSLIAVLLDSEQQQQQQQQQQQPEKKDTSSQKRLSDLLSEKLSSQPGRLKLSTSSIDWIQDVVGKVLISASLSFPKELQGAEFQAELSFLVSKTKIFCATNAIPVKETFYAAWIEALFPQPSSSPAMNDAEVAVLRCNSWEDAYKVATSIIDSLDDVVGRTPAVYHALISVLCRYQDAAATSRAQHEFNQAVADGNNPKALLPETYAVLVESAVYCLGDEQLSQILKIVEDIITQQPGTDEYLARNPAVLLARLRAHARLCHGFKSLELLRSLRLRKSELKYNRGPERHSYSWVINALYLAWPGSDAEWRIATDPCSTSEYILREMQRDGHFATSATIAQLLKLFTKACQINRKQGAASLISDAESFVRSARQGGYLGHPKVVVTDLCIREIVKACCLAEQEERAISVIDKAEAEFGVRPTALCWEPLIFYYASKKGAVTTAEDILTMMINRKVPITSVIVDAFVTGLLKQGDAAEGLDRVEEIFNQYGVRPAPATLLKLLDHSLKCKDVYEAKRVASAVQQLFTSEERDRSSVWLSTTARETGAKYFAEARAARLGAESGVTQKQDHEITLRHDTYRLRGGTQVGPAIKGALSNESIAKRFEMHGVQVN